MAAQSTLLIRTEDKKDDELLAELNEYLKQEGIGTKVQRQQVRDKRGEAQGLLTVLGVILGARAVVKFAEKMGDALVGWVKGQAPRTVLVIEYKGRSIRLESNQIKNPKSIVQKISALLDEDGGEQGGGTGKHGTKG